MPGLIIWFVRILCTSEGKNINDQHSGHWRTADGARASECWNQSTFGGSAEHRNLAALPPRWVTRLLLLIQLYDSQLTLRQGDSCSCALTPAANVEGGQVMGSEIFSDKNCFDWRSELKKTAFLSVSWVRWQHFVGVRCKQKDKTIRS